MHLHEEGRSDQEKEKLEKEILWKLSKGFFLKIFIYFFFGEKLATTFSRIHLDLKSLPLALILHYSHLLHFFLRSLKTKQFIRNSRDFLPNHQSKRLQPKIKEIKNKSGLIFFSSIHCYDLVNRIQLHSFRELKDLGIHPLFRSMTPRHVSLAVQSDPSAFGRDSELG